MNPTHITSIIRLAASLRRLLYCAGLSVLCLGAAQAQPTVTGFTPARNALAVPRATSVAVSFSQPLSNTPTTQQALRVFSQQAGGQKVGTATVSGNTLTFQPSTAFQPGETVSATLTTGVQNGSGQALAQPQVVQFTTATAPSSGTFRAVNGVPLATYSSYNSTAVGDIDGDGDLDFVTDEGIQLNDGTGGFSPGPQPGLGGTVLGDIDGDGDLDLLNFYLSGRNLDSNVRVFLNNGTGTFSSGQVFIIGRHAQRLALGDVDADGDLDLVTVHVLDGLTADIYFNNGAGVFSGGLRYL